MTVPKASVNENHRVVLSKCEIGLSGEVLAVNAKPKSKAMERRSDHFLWLRILSLDPRHHSTADIRCDGVGSHVSSCHAGFGKQKLVLAC